MIYNHVNARISDLDMMVAVSVPPGGNWKDVPLDIPLARLDTIRRGYAEGTGSRSTYYGRLRPDRPSYTINTHFTRPGNGCHLHYDYAGGQHRTLSLREAARLQSFPDDFVFMGSRASIAKQIGNAVPPLLAYQLARSLGAPGLFVDLFSGCGGLGLGFVWAGWTPVVASDVDSNFLMTHSENMSCPVVPGDIRDQQVVLEILNRVGEVRAKHPKLPLWVLGGPPCQGFSTAGKRRSMDDERNHLFRDYASIVEELHPTGFVFENVMGLLNMQGGEVFKTVRKQLSDVMPFVGDFVVKSEQFGVPQRRSRVILIGHRLKKGAPTPPQPITTMEQGLSLLGHLPPAITVEEAIGDLPRLGNGVDGSGVDYRFDPRTNYQRLMRGIIGPDEFILSLQE